LKRQQTANSQRILNLFLEGKASKITGLLMARVGTLTTLVVRGIVKNGARPHNTTLDFAQTLPYAQFVRAMT
jgi:hypothetical protein